MGSQTSSIPAPLRVSIPVIGLTGGIGAGKSLVARCFERLGCAVIDADSLAREAMESEDVRTTLTAWWGQGVCDAAGKVERKQVAAVVFGNPAELARLEGLLHPLVHTRRHALRSQLAADSAVRAIIEDSPLLLEKNFVHECDVVVHVQVTRSVRLARVARRRGWSAGELERREKNQWPLDKKRKRADYVVTNDADEDHCFHQVRRVFFPDTLPMTDGMVDPACVPVLIAPLPDLRLFRAAETLQTLLRSDTRTSWTGYPTPSNVWFDNLQDRLDFKHENHTPTRLSTRIHPPHKANYS